MKLTRSAKWGATCVLGSWTFFVVQSLFMVIPTLVGDTLHFLGFSASLAWGVFALYSGPRNLTTPALRPSGRPHRVAVGFAVGAVASPLVAAIAQPQLEAFAYAQVRARIQLAADAIDLFMAREGRVPRSLTELVPNYLPEAPEAGVSGCPDWKYSVYESPLKATPGQPRAYGHRWGIRFHCRFIESMECLIPSECGVPRLRPSEECKLICRFSGSN